MNRPPRSSTRATDGRYQLLTWLQGMQQRGQATWAKLTARERIFVTTGGLAILLIAIWLLAIKPALSSIHMDHQRIVSLQTDLARVQALGLQAQTLRSRVLTRDIPIPSTVELQGSLTQAGLPVTVEPLAGSNVSADGEQWQLRIEQAKVDGLMQWLAESLRAYNLRIVQATLQRAEVDHRDRPGYVTGIISLANGGA